MKVIKVFKGISYSQIFKL